MAALALKYYKDASFYPLIAIATGLSPSQTNSLQEKQVPVIPDRNAFAKAELEAFRRATDADTQGMKKKHPN